MFKTANEGTARVFAAESGLNSIGLRPHVVYGPCRDHGLTSATTAAMRAAAHGNEYSIPFGGRCEMQYAPDVAAAFIAATRTGFRGATVVNVPGTALGVDEIVATIERAAPEAAGRISYEGPPLPFPDELDSTSFATVVGDVALTPFADGVAATIDHFRVRAESD